MAQRGASEDEIARTVESGEEFPAKHGRTGFRRNFKGNWARNGKQFDMKQLEAYAVRESGEWLVITVIVKYFQGTAR
jgi:hypothetical protein